MKHTCLSGIADAARLSAKALIPLLLMMKMKNKGVMELSNPAASHLLVLEVAIETIVSELEMILDDELDSHSHAVETLDAHNLSHLFTALAEAETALVELCANGVSGASEALASLRGFSQSLDQADVEKIRELFAEVDPQELLENGVLKAISGD